MYIDVAKQISSKGRSMNPNTKPVVFVGSTKEKLPITKAVVVLLDEVARVVSWTGISEPSNFFISDLLKTAKEVDYAVFILSPDDITESRNIIEASPRDNIIFEAGLFMGAIGREKVFLLRPKDIEVKQPSDLFGINVLFYSQPNTTQNQLPTIKEWRNSLEPVTIRLEEAIQRMETERIKFNQSGFQKRQENNLYTNVYNSLKEAASDIKNECKNAEVIKILSIKGVSIIGRDDSIISTAELESYNALKKLRVLLLNTHSRWLRSPIAQKREKESIDEWIEEIKTSQKLAEIGLGKFIRSIPDSAIRYFTSEPNFRIIMTENAAFVSNYADDKKKTQSRDLPVFKFENTPGSFYSAFRRRFNDIWNNEAGLWNQPSTLTTSAGGIVYCDFRDTLKILLLRRTDGNWVLPKGHKILEDKSTKSTALREIHEEAGISTNDLFVEELIGSYADTRFSENKEVFIYSIKYAGNSLPTLKPDKTHTDAAWFILEEALTIIGNIDQRNLLEKFAVNKNKSVDENKIFLND